MSNRYVVPLKWIYRMSTVTERKKRIVWIYNGTTQLYQHESNAEDSCRTNQNLGKKTSSLNLPPQDVRGAWKARGPQLPRKLTLAGEILRCQAASWRSQPPNTECRHCQWRDGRHTMTPSTVAAPAPVAQSARGRGASAYLFTHRIYLWICGGVWRQAELGAIETHSTFNP